MESPQQQPSIKGEDPPIEFKEAEDALRASEEQLSTFVNATSEIVYEMSADWRELRYLQGKEFIASTNEPRSDWMDAYIPEDDKERVWAAICRAVEARSTFELEHRIICLDGTVGWTFSRAIPILNDAGEIAKWFGEARDITNRKHAEKALREGEQRLTAFFDQAAVGLFEMTLQGRFVRVNAELCRLLGRSSDELLTLGIADVTHPEDISASFAKVRELIDTRQPVSLDKRYLRPNGDYIVASSTLTLLLDEHGEPESLLGVTVDLTARKATEAALRESQQRYRLLVEGIEDYAIFMLDLEGRITSWNEGVERLLGYTEEEWIGQPGAMIFTPEDREKGEPEKEIKTAVREGRALDERWHLRKKGERFFASGVLTAMRDEAGKLWGFAKIMRDVTSRKQMEDELKAAHDELEARVLERTLELATINIELHNQTEELRRSEDSRRLLLQRIVNTQEEERHRIARELHDQMGQQLTALLIGLKALSAATGSQVSTVQHPEVKTLQAQVEDLMASVHHLAWEMRPAVLDNIGLKAALSQYLDEWSKQSKIGADFLSRGFSDSMRLPEELETTFYRVAQEALTNVQRHAEAKLVSVVLESDGEVVTVIIEDDGKGFDVEDKSNHRRTGRLGILGMRERMELVGGSLTVESSRHNGTTVYARAKLKTERGEAT